MKKSLHLFILLLCTFNTLKAQKVICYTTTESEIWKQGKASLSRKPSSQNVLTVQQSEDGVEFKGWGTTFNELDLDAMRMLKQEEQEEVMHNLYAPDGELHFTHARISMNANDYSRAWYSCDSVDGDFELKYFNIDHDKQNIVVLAKMAKKYCPTLQLFMSPWSPPAWMKINHDYPVLSSKYNNLNPQKNYMLYSGVTGRDDKDGRQYYPDEMKLLGDRDGVFPRRLATQDYFIQDPRYLTAYANMFCKFIDLYAAEGLPITKVMYQNEAYSYTPYPGCAWTAEGTLKFNNEYLAPILKAKHPEVELWIGTFNTNRLDYVEKILDDATLQKNIKGVGTQWECRQNLPEMRKRYPNLHFMMSESECGNGQMDWNAAEHTFFLLCDNLGNGCEEYYNWNFILPDNGISTWGWTQNGLIQVNSKTHTIRYTPEYYAYKHFSHFVATGYKMVGYNGRKFESTPIVVFNNENTYVVIFGNFTDSTSSASVELKGKYLNVATKPHSFATYIISK